MDRDILLVRYGTHAANRRHFDNLFFAVIAFSCGISLALWTAIRALRAAPGGFALLAAGVILLGGAFIAHRLMLRERAAFEAMMTTWRELAGEPIIESAARLRPGAMSIAAAGQGLAGLLCIAAGAIALL